MSRLICEQRAVAAAHAAQAEVKRMSGRLEAVDALGAPLRALVGSTAVVIARSKSS